VFVPVEIDDEATPLLPAPIRRLLSGDVMLRGAKLSLRRSDSA
jgi:hypothetical protein